MNYCIEEKNKSTDSGNTRPDNAPQKQNDPLQFFIGIILLGVGLFIFSNKVIVTTLWYHWGFFSFGGHNFSNGLIVFPLIIGIIMFFYNPKSIPAKIVIILGAIFIIVTIIMSVHISFTSTTLYEYIIILGMIAAGGGLLLRSLFGKK